MKPAPAQAECGFTLLELSIVLMIIALVTGMSLSMSISVVATARLSATQQKMKIIEDALMAYRVANDRLPCPGDLTLPATNVNYGIEAGAATGSTIGVGTGVCTGGSMSPAANFTGTGTTNASSTAAEGALPALTLGLPADMMVDGWGNRFRYAVDIAYTANGYFTGNAVSGCTTAAITVNDSNGNARSTGAVYALISSGANGHGAYSKAGVIVNTGSVNANEQTNCHCNSSATATTYSPTYVQMLQTLDSTNALDSFDDFVSYKERWQLQTPWDKVSNCFTRYLYAADGGGNRVEVFNMSGSYLSQIGGCSSGDCASSVANGAFSNANGQVDGIAIDSSGNIWVLDTTNNRVEEFNSSGTWLQTIPSSGCTNGTAPACPNSTANGKFTQPTYITIDSSGNIYVSDQYNNRVEKLNSSGSFLLGIGAGYQGVGGSVGATGTASGKFNAPEGIKVDGSGNIWVVDNQNNRVQKFNSSGTYVSQLGCASGTCSTSCANGKFSGNTEGLAIDASNNIWVGDNGCGRVEEFNSSGSYLSQFSVNYPNDLYFDSSGNLWVASQGNFTVLEYNTSGSLLQTIGSQGTTNGQFSNPGVNNVAVGR